jgi:hypothetical protein
MRKSLAALLLGIIASGTLLAIPAQAAIDGITIEGVLTNAETNTPFADSEVMIVIIDNTDDERCGGLNLSAMTEKARTDANGKFTKIIKDLFQSKKVPSDCTLLVVANPDEPGYFSPSNEAVRQTGTFRYGDTLTFTIPILPGVDPDIAANAVSEAASASAAAQAEADAAEAATTGNENLGANIGVGILVVLGIAAAVALFVLFVWILPRAVARAAVRKGRNFWPWFWIAFFFLIPAAIIVAILGPKSESAVASSTSNSPTKNCPHCGEQILQVATKCKHCGEFLDDSKNTAD